jgi:hypothetical protein
VTSLAVIDPCLLPCLPCPACLACPALPTCLPAAFSSANSSFDWELQSLASALPPGTAEDHLELDHT